jgi:hypothetical protein
MLFLLAVQSDAEMLNADHRAATDKDSQVGAARSAFSIWP